MWCNNLLLDLVTDKYRTLFFQTLVHQSSICLKSIHVDACTNAYKYVQLCLLEEYAYEEVFLCLSRKYYDISNALLITADTKK